MKLGSYCSYNVFRTVCTHINEAMNYESFNLLFSPTRNSLVYAEQPLMLNEEKQILNVRKLTELPYCLVKCQRMDELKQLLTDYSWLKACIRTMPCADIINWFSDVIPVVPLER